MEGHREDEKTVKMGEEGPLRLEKGIEVGEKASANLFFQNWNHRQSVKLLLTTIDRQAEVRETHTPR